MSYPIFFFLKWLDCYMQCLVKQQRLCFLPGITNTKHGVSIHLSTWPLRGGGGDAWPLCFFSWIVYVSYVVTSNLLHGHAHSCAFYKWGHLCTFTISHWLLNGQNLLTVLSYVWHTGRVTVRTQQSFLSVDKSRWFSWPVSLFFFLLFAV